MWNGEVESILPFLFGCGVDIGAGGRSIFADDVRVDCDEEREPNIVARGDDLPFEDGKFDYLYSIHSFEHFEDQEKTMREWIRVIRKGGIIAIVHPDLDYTGKQKPFAENMDKDPYNFHTFERNHSQFLDYLKANNYFGLKLIATGAACQNWSFFVVLKKNGVSV
jgi:predicted SAM-dependent methyltransferase